MGIGELFVEGKANLSGVLEKGEELFVSKAVHKAFIEITEDGTEAAAASSNTNSNSFQLVHSKTILIKCGFFRFSLNNAIEWTLF